MRRFWILPAVRAYSLAPAGPFQSGERTRATTGASQSASPGACRRVALRASASSQARRPRNTAAFASNTTVSSRDGTCR